jgi:hypothetical protein
MLRFSTIKYALPERKIGTELGDAPVIEKGEDPEIIEFLKQLIFIFHDDCNKFTEELAIEFQEESKQGVDRDKSAEDARKALDKYVKKWENYFMTSLEVDNYLSPINTMMNEATRKLLPTIKKSFPDFNIWRVLAACFIELVYGSLRSKLSEGFLNFLRKTCETIVDNHFKEKIEFPELKAKVDITKYVQSDLSALTLGGAPLEIFNEDERICQLQRAFLSFIDMGINEVSSHFIKYRKFQNQACIEISPFLTKAVEGIMEHTKKMSKEKKKNSQETIQMIYTLASIFRRIFPACLWTEIDGKVCESINWIAKEQIDLFAGEFKKLGDAERKSYKSVTGYKKLPRLVSALKPPLKMEGDDRNRFLAYMVSKHEKESKQFEANLNCQDNAKDAEYKRAVDTEIELKTESLGIMMKDEEDGSYNISGISYETIKKLTH